MNPATVMEELALVLDSVEGLKGRTFGYPPNALVPPAAVVGWPDEGNNDVTAARGAWSVKFPLLIVVGKSDIRSARDTIGAYLDTAGPASVPAALDAGLSFAYDSALVTKWHVEPVSIAGIEYLAALLDVEITGGQ